MSEDRETHAVRAVMELRAMILSGMFKHGERLAETLISERLGLSRTPLRQAFDRLVSEGLLERGPKGGCRVVRVSMDDIVDSITLRGVLEGTAARLAAERGISDSHRASTSRVLGKLDEAVNGPNGVDFDAYVELNSEFHTLLGKSAGSHIIAREVERVCRFPVAGPDAFLQGQDLVPDYIGSMRGAQRQHRAIFDAIVNREGARAEALAREHARLALENLKYIITEKPTFAERVPGLSLVVGNG